MGWPCATLGVQLGVQLEVQHLELPGLAGRQPLAQPLCQLFEGICDPVGPVMLVTSCSILSCHLQRVQGGCRVCS